MSARVEVLSDSEDEAPVAEPAPLPSNPAPPLDSGLSATAPPQPAPAPARLPPADEAALLEGANVHKELGNTAFAAHDFDSAITHYSAAITHSEAAGDAPARAVFYANRAACLMELHRVPEAVQDCTVAVRMDPRYIKAWLRRARGHEQLDKVEEALADYKRALDVDPAHRDALVAARRLEPIVKERQDKATAEMMSQLKGLGNTILGKFGLSLDNFNLQKDPATGSYSVQFNQGAASAAANPPPQEQ